MTSIAPLCNLCGSAHASLVLTTPRLDGPLYKCESCGLYFVVVPPVVAVLTAREDVERLAERARELSLVNPLVENGERHWRLLTARERLEDLKRATGLDKGALLEIGSSGGEFLLAAGVAFAATGIEADASSFASARSLGLNCIHGAVFDADLPDAAFDVAVMYHVIEHFPDPGAVLGELHRLIRPGGWLVIETPDIDNFWFRILGRRWRQFIPDHRYFFSPVTLARLCEKIGFEVVAQRHATKAMSLRLFIDRLGRYNRPLARVCAFISQLLSADRLTLKLNPGDVMRVYARRRS